MKIHHIGYLVKKIDKAVVAFENLGYTLEAKPVYDDYRDADICFLSKDGYRIELVSPKTKESVVYDMYKRIGNSPYHICYETEDFEADMKNLIEQHYVLCSERYAAPAISGRDVCFLVHPYMGMVELLAE